MLDGYTAVAASSVDVDHAQLVAYGTSVSATRGAPINQQLAEFQDFRPGDLAADFAVTIDWGDGFATPGVVAHKVTGSEGYWFSVFPSDPEAHVYANPGTYTIYVSVTHPLTIARATVSTTALVQHGSPEVTAHHFQAIPAVPFMGGVAEIWLPGSTNLPTNFTASIAWGDGSTTAGQVTGGNGHYAILAPAGGHTYAVPAQYTAIVTAMDTLSGETGTSQTTAVVTFASIAPTLASFRPTQGVPFNDTVATFSAPLADPLSGFSAVIDWRDGVTSVGTIFGGGGSFRVNGVHTYRGTARWSPPR